MEEKSKLPGNEERKFWLTVMNLLFPVGVRETDLKVWFPEKLKALFLRQNNNTTMKFLELLFPALYHLCIILFLRK